MVYHSSGFSHSELYTMPVHLRKFYERQLIDIRKKENEEARRRSSKK